MSRRARRQTRRMRYITLRYLQTFARVQLGINERQDAKDAKEEEEEEKTSGGGTRCARRGILLFLEFQPWRSWRLGVHFTFSGVHVTHIEKNRPRASSSRPSSRSSRSLSCVVIEGLLIPRRLLRRKVLEQVAHLLIVQPGKQTLGHQRGRHGALVENLGLGNDGLLLR